MPLLSLRGGLGLLVLTRNGAVRAFQLAKNDGGKNGQAAQDEERVVNAVNHFRGARMKAIGNKECGG